MKIQQIVTLMGKDQQGLFNKLTADARAVGATWLANKLTHLDGFVSGLLKVELDSDELDTFKERMAAYPELQVSFYNPEATSPNDAPALKLVIEGEDRSGLTSEITEVLLNAQTHIDHFESQRFPIAGLDTRVYEAEIIVKLPVSLSSDELVSRLESIDRGIRVFVE